MPPLTCLNLSTDEHIPLVCTYDRRRSYSKKLYYAIAIWNVFVFSYDSIIRLGRLVDLRIEK